MKKILLVLPLFTLAACEGSIANKVKEVATENYKSGFADGTPITTSDTELEEFSGLAISGPDNVVFTSGDDHSIRAEGDTEVVETLRYKLKDGTLKIGRDDDGFNWDNKNAATIYVSGSLLKKVSVAGSGDVKVDKMSGESSKISIAGSGNMSVDAVESETLKASIAGSGNLKMAGKADTVKLSIAGSGDVKAKELSVDEAKISVAGSGGATLSSDGNVKASVAGSGDVRIHGKAKCKSSAMGSGEVKCG